MHLIISTLDLSSEKTMAIKTIQRTKFKENWTHNYDSDVPKSKFQSIKDVEDVIEFVYPMIFHSIFPFKGLTQEKYDIFLEGG